MISNTTAFRLSCLLFLLSAIACGQTAGPAVVKTLVYHQITNLADNGPDYRTSLAISGSGNVLAYGYSPSPSKTAVFTMNPDGTGLRQADAYTALCYCGAVVDVSDDGALVASTDSQQIRLAGGGTLINIDGGGNAYITGIRVEGDKKRIFFLLARDAVYRGTSTGIQRGLYVMNGDGSSLRQIVGPAAIAGLLGAATVDNMSPEFSSGSSARALDVSADGSHIVFAARKNAGGTTGGIFGVNLDGSNLHQLLGPVTPYSVGISGDGSKAIYNVVPGGLSIVMGVLNFDGTGGKVLGSPAGYGNGFAALSSDGSRALWFDTLYNTDGSAVTQLSTGLSSLVSIGLEVHMNGAASRFFYNFAVPGTLSQGLTQLATLDINPLNAGAAPGLSAPALAPAYLLTDGSNRATLTAEPGFSGFKSPLVAFRFMRNGLQDFTLNGSGGQGGGALADDGTQGDVRAGDGIYTDNGLVASNSTPTGWRTVRILAQGFDGAGLRHATVLEISPLYVVARLPEAAPAITSLTPKSGTAGTSVLVAGSGFDPTAANNLVSFGGLAAQITGASPTSLTIVVPNGLSPGCALVAVSTPVQSSNTVPFTVVVPGTTLPAISGGGVVNGASFGGWEAGGSIGSIFGINFGAATVSAANLPLPTTLNGVSVQINGAPAPLFFVSPNQINFQFPWELVSQTLVTIAVNVNGTVGPALSVALSATGPGIFALSSPGTPQGIVQISNTAILAAPAGSIAGIQTRPAIRGVESLTIYCTGLGDVYNRPANGAAASTTALSATKATPTVTIGGVPTAVSFSGLVPGLVGLYQVNAQVPANAPSGNAVPLIVNAGGIASNTVTIAVQ